MQVLGFREVLPRTFSHKFGEPPTAELKYIVTVDEPIPAGLALSTVGIPHGAVHPENPFLKMTEYSVTELDRQHVEITYRYTVPDNGKDDPNPLARPDVWSFSTSGAVVPAFSYYDGTQRKALVNSANEYIEGVETEEGECRATITGNRAVFPLALAVAVTNTINDSPYLGAPAFTWKCTGISGQQQTEVVNEAEVNYWSISVQLVYRQSGWTLLIPDVGYTYIGIGGVRKRAYVIDEEGGVKDSPNPVPLTADGSLKFTGPPNMLERRVNMQTNFSSFFGVPPWL